MMESKMPLLSPAEYFYACKESRQKTLEEKKIQKRWRYNKLHRLLDDPNPAKLICHRMDYREMHAKQKGLCAICGKPETSKDPNGAIKRLSVDHCHDSGRIRGLLCARCNSGLGHFKDNIDSLKGAIEYLKQYGEVT